jgi:indole-3-glycerol phosphate synthase
MDILANILKNKKKEVEERKSSLPVAKLGKKHGFNRKCYSLTEHIRDPLKTGILAEFKRKSPSRGIINSEITIEEVTTGYFRSGASALSILTDEGFFGGSLKDLVRARELNPLPILRKDFIIDEYQIIESRANGADAILLIAAVLDKGKIEKLTSMAHSLGMQVVLEIHEEAEITSIPDNIDVAGINNRDLRSFEVDIETSFRLADRIPKGLPRISESGISSPLVIRKLRNYGFEGFLIGENFMLAADPVKAFSDFANLIFRPDDKD